MSIVTDGERRNIGDDKFKVLITNFESAAGTMWLMGADLALSSFAHANKHSHSPDRIVQAYAVMIKCDVKTVEDAFKRACERCTGITLSVDKETGKINTKFSKEKYEKILASDLDPLDIIEAKGLKAYKPVVKKGSKKNPVTGKDKFHVMGNDVADVLTKINEIDPDNAVVTELMAKLEAVKAQLETEFTKLSATKKLAAGLAPANDEVPASAVSSL